MVDEDEVVRVQDVVNKVAVYKVVVVKAVVNKVEVHKVVVVKEKV